MSDQHQDFDALRTKAEKLQLSATPAHEFMETNPLLISEGTKIYSAIQALTAHKVCSAAVVNQHNKIVGVVSEHDLLIQAATKDVILPIEFTHTPVTVPADTPLMEVLTLLYKRKVRRIPVVGNDHKVLGTVTRMNVLLKLISKGK